jgi:hypothetical protein
MRDDESSGYFFFMTPAPPSPSVAGLMTGAVPCSCALPEHPPKLVVLTGGPGAGKTAVLELAARTLCQHLGVLPEAASIVFGGGFPRMTSDTGRRAAQRAIFHVQRELETLELAERRLAVALCDRGTVDGVAYYPGSPESFFAELGTTLESEVGRYHAVIHLQTPGPKQGYNHRNVLRVESAVEAGEIDRRIEVAWQNHPRRFLIPSSANFVQKAARALQVIHDQLPPCCQEHHLLWPSS